MSPFEIKNLSWYEKLAVRIISWVLKLWWWTLRIRPTKNFQRLISSSQPYVIVFWHQNLFAIGELYRRFRQHMKMYGMISASKDGAWLVELLKLLGIHEIRGSSSRGGAEALRRTIEELKSGNDVAITPDGPRGPKFCFHSGAIRAALNSNKPVLAIKIQQRHAKTLSSWDAFKIPYPFSRMDIDAKLFTVEELEKSSDISVAAEEIRQYLNS